MIDTITNIRKGNTYLIEITVKESDGSIKDLSLVNRVNYLMSKSVNTIDPLITKTLADANITIPNPTDGIVNIILTGIDTKDLPDGKGHHEVMICESTGATYTILSEDVQISKQTVVECT